MDHKFGLSLQDIEKISGVLRLHSEVEKAIVYGSRALGSFQSASDIDLTLIGCNLTLDHLLRIGGEFDDLMLPYRIDLSLFQGIEDPSVIEHIQTHGQEFYRRLR